jgi:hypothetical protein
MRDPVVRRGPPGVSGLFRGRSSRRPGRPHLWNQPGGTSWPRHSNQHCSGTYHPHGKEGVPTGRRLLAHGSKAIDPFLDVLASDLVERVVPVAGQFLCARVRRRDPPPRRSGGLPDHDEQQLHRADDCDVEMAGVFAPEPWRDPPPYPPPPTRYRESRDPFTGQAETGDTELSRGEGLVAPHANGTAPADGGQYMPRCPRVDPPRYGVGAPRQHQSPRGSGGATAELLRSRTSQQG